MEEIIKDQLQSLKKQREQTTRELRDISFNGMQDFTRKAELETQVNLIDSRIDILLDRLQTVTS